MSSLPEELRHVAGLTLLDISHNHFEALPQVIYRLEALRKLRAEDNNIKGILCLIFLFTLFGKERVYALKKYICLLTDVANISKQK